MGLFGNSKQEKLNELEEKVITVGISSLSSFEMSSEERIKIIEDIEDSLEQNFTDSKKSKRNLIRRTCEKISYDYPDFADRVDFMKDFVCNEIDDGNPIDVEMFNVLLDAIHWKHVVTPDDAEQILKNIRAEKGVLSSQDYKKIMAKIGEKYEDELLQQLETVASESIMSWIDENKRNGKVITDTVYKKAMEVKNK